MLEGRTFEEKEQEETAFRTAIVSCVAPYCSPRAAAARAAVAASRVSRQFSTSLFSLPRELSTRIAEFVGGPGLQSLPEEVKAVRAEWAAFDAAFASGIVAAKATLPPCSY